MIFILKTEPNPRTTLNVSITRRAFIATWQSRFVSPRFSFIFFSVLILLQTSFDHSSVLFALTQQQIAMDEQSQLLEAATDFAHYPGI
jgi:hypothetical protein